tara:strand:+ start:972 stop:1442 length:471 start_codon:yes stop_codon:yes gene_type:complete
VNATDDMEMLRQLKARYCRFLDGKDWAAWRALFTDDFVSDTRASGGPLIEGGDAFVAYVRKTLGPQYRKTVHQVHAPELQIQSENAASGIWALEDFVRFFPGLSLRGYGHYHETYEKAGGEWRIKTSTLTRLRGDLHTPLFSFSIPGWGTATPSKS